MSESGPMATPICVTVPEELASIVRTPVFKENAFRHIGETDCVAGRRSGGFYVLHIGERDTRRALAPVVEKELVWRQIDEIGVEIGRDCRTVGLDKGLELLEVLRRNPARDLELADVEFDRQGVFGREPVAQHVELERADDADQGRRAIERTEHLNDSLLRHLLERLLELLGLHGVGES
jgi:hypothetical protein